MAQNPNYVRDDIMQGTLMAGMPDKGERPHMDL